jgi:hypothetical protein
MKVSTPDILDQGCVYCINANGSVSIEWLPHLKYAFANHLNYEDEPLALFPELILFDAFTKFL